MATELQIGNTAKQVVDATHGLPVEIVTGGTSATALGKAEDAAHVSGDTGVMSLAVRKDTAASTAADGDYHPIEVDSSGRLWTHVATVDAGENHLGAIGGHVLMPTVTFSLDTSAYTANDLLADTQAVSNALRTSGGTGVLQSIQILDEDDQAAAGMTVYILNANNSMGTENNAISVTDANARAIIGVINIASGDWIDLGGCKIAFKSNLSIPLKVSTGTSIWIALQTAGTPTQTASGITGVLGILAD